MFSWVQLFYNPMDSSPQTPLSIGFSRQEYCSWLPFPSPGDLPNPGIKLTSVLSPTSADRFFTSSAAWKAQDSGRGSLIPSWKKGQMLNRELLMRSPTTTAEFCPNCHNPSQKKRYDTPPPAPNCGRVRKTNRFAVTENTKKSSLIIWGVDRRQRSSKHTIPRGTKLNKER